MRYSVLAATACAAWITLGCDDSDSGGGFTTTTLSAPTTTVSGPTTTFGGIGSTTTIVPGTTVSTSTTSSSTREEPEAPRDCVITWSVTNAVTLGALQFVTDYSSTLGDFRGAFDSVECDALTGSLASFNENDSQRTLTAGFISIGGFTAPLDVMTCNFFIDVDKPIPDASSLYFGVTVIDATDPSVHPVQADVAVTSVACTGTTTTTTTTVPSGNDVVVDIVLSDDVNVGALQLIVGYSDVPGGFLRAGEEVACAFPSQADSYASFFDDESTTLLNAAFVSLGGLQGPRTLAECAFIPDGEISASDFEMTVIEAMRPDLTRIDPLPSVTVEVFR